MTYNEWVAKYKGKKIDYDKAYGVQCVDLIKSFVANVLEVKPQSIGNAIDYYKKRKSSKYLTDNFVNHNYAKGFKFKKGDVLVLKGKSKYGHICVCTGTYDDKGVYAYDENYKGKGDGMTRRYFEYDGYYRPLNILRPKAQDKIVGKDVALFGVDISEHNGRVIFKELKNNVDFVIIRLGWTGNKHNHTLDKKFKYNYKWAKKRGIPVGVYVYLYNNSTASATDAARWTVQQLQGKALDIPYVFADMEDKSIASLGKKKLTDITFAFNKELEKLGRKAGVYANADWLKNKLDADALKKAYPIWIAHYTTGTNKYKGEYAMWQNSSKGKVGGVSGNVDTNYMYTKLFI